MPPESERPACQGGAPKLPDDLGLTDEVNVAQQPPAINRAAPLAPPGPKALQPPVRVAPDEIRRTITLLFEPEQVFEVRILNGQPASGWQKARTFAGYFCGREGDAVIRALLGLKAWEGVYITLNPLDETILALSAGRIKEAKTTATDADVLSRQLMLVDFDPQRRSGISSTEAEHEAAVARTHQVRAYLCEEMGWPEPIVASSGNGAHLVFRVCLQRDSDLVERALRALHALFSDEHVHIDTGVHNPGRISKLYGTLACKGDSIPERPHRMARIIGAPGSLDVVATKLLEALIIFAGVDVDRGSSELPDRRAHADSSMPFDVQGFLDRHGIAVHHSGAWRGGTRWVLSSCPMDDSHGSDLAAYVVQFPNGAIAAGCLHERCKWIWKQLRERFEPRSIPSVISSPTVEPIATRPIGNGLTVGTRVRASDRGNVGTIVSVSPNGHSADVLFVSREGIAATKIMALSELSPDPGSPTKPTIAPRAYRFLGVDEILNGEWPEYLVDGILDRGNLGVIYGEPASFKTFVALDLAARVALGVPWHGQHHTRMASVVYVMAEGQLGLRLRLSAWLRVVRQCVSTDPTLNLDDIKEALRPRFFAFDDAVPLIEATEVDNFIAALLRLAEDIAEMPGLIVLDTLARCFLGGDENSSRDMGLLVEACNAIRKRTGAAVLLIHHTGKDKELERGSSALRAAADSMLKVTRGEPLEGAEGRARVTVEKRKDGAGEADLEFDLWKVDLEPRADGVAVSSLSPSPATVTVPRQGGIGQGRQRKTTARQQELEILGSLAMTVNRKGASASVIKEVSGVPRASAYKRLSSLVDGGCVEMVERGRSSVYTITASGLQRLSLESRQSPASRDKWGSPQSPQSPQPPLRGVETRAETETRSAKGEGARD